LRPHLSLLAFVKKKEIMQTLKKKRMREGERAREREKERDRERERVRYVSSSRKACSRCCRAISF
jgi:hypothetical protein